MRKKPDTGKRKSPGRSRKGKSVFPVVAIGASAGGLEAVSQFLRHLPSDTGMAYFYIQHLSRDHPSSLGLLLSRSTKMKVLEADDRLKVKPDHLYVCTPGKEMTVVNGSIRLRPRRADKLYYLIDEFFTSLAASYGKNTIGIVLSGNASDGTRGLMKIRKAGGLTFAQDNSAKYESMPRSAINNGAAIMVLSPKEMARELAAYGKNASPSAARRRQKKETTVAGDPEGLKSIFEILYKRTGVDFSNYKISTIRRRLSYRNASFRCKNPEKIP